MRRTPNFVPRGPLESAPCRDIAHAPSVLRPGWNDLMPGPARTQTDDLTATYSWPSSMARKKQGLWWHGEVNRPGTAP